MQGKSVFGMNEAETIKHMEAAWKELRTKNLAMGKPFLVTEDTAELPNGEIVTLSELVSTCMHKRSKSSNQ